MAYSDDNLKNFTQKVQELLWKQEKNYLSEDDLNYIAQEIGMNAEDIAQAREDYYNRGQGHLAHDNWTEAIQEFEQLLFLSPKHQEAHYGLAKAYYELWLKENKKAHKTKAQEYAKQCIQYDPQNTKAYALIKKLKGKRLKNVITHTPKTQTQTGKTSFGEIFVSTLTGFALIFGLYLIYSGVIQPMFNSSELVNPDEFQVVAANKKGAVAWFYKSDMNENHTIRIINPTNRKILKEISLEEDISDFIYIDGNFYYTLSDDFEGRDIYTGEKIDSKEILTRYHEELGQGIGEARWYGGAENWLLLTLKEDGSNYLYSPALKKVIPFDKRHSNKDLIDINLWYEIKKGKLSQFFLIKTQMKTTEYSGKEARISKFRRDLRLKYFEKQLSFKSPEFLEAEKIYGDQDVCIVSHQTEIGKDAKKIISAINKEGKTLWEFNTESNNAPIIIEQLLKEKLPMNVYRHENQLLLSTKRITYQDKIISVAAAIDIYSGKTLWQYSPTMEF